MLYLCKIQQPSLACISYTKTINQISYPYIISFHCPHLWKSNISLRIFLETGGLGPPPYWRKALFIGEFLLGSLSQVLSSLRFKCYNLKAGEGASGHQKWWCRYKRKATLWGGALSMRPITADQRGCTGTQSRCKWPDLLLSYLQGR